MPAHETFHFSNSHRCMRELRALYTIIRTSCTTRTGRAFSYARRSCVSREHFIRGDQGSTHGRTDNQLGARRRTCNIPRTSESNRSTLRTDVGAFRANNKIGLVSLCRGVLRAALHRRRRHHYCRCLGFIRGGRNTWRYRGGKGANRTVARARNSNRLLVYAYTLPILQPNVSIYLHLYIHIYTIRILELKCTHTHDCEYFEVYFIYIFSREPAASPTRMRIYSYQNESLMKWMRVIYAHTRAANILRWVEEARARPGVIRDVSCGTPVVTVTYSERIEKFRRVK
ncbi:unnamed protein product [Trichogramma brassicae]|uniref:Uncharacterized protein n=1 Tax=Trichogramma brassicae TaxID=86971 RepID=A0A6H5I9K0_9HYME|nr:unnamed protein product [Trichogramma brassicae]